jgi:predicted dehydrogenase
MNYVLIGLGKQGKQYLRALRMFTNKTQDIFLCDIDKKYTQNLAKSMDSTNWSDSYLEAIKSKTGTIIIAVPNDEYLKIFSSISQCRLSIIKEKPLARNWIEAQEILNVAAKKSWRFNVAQTRFFANHYLSAKKWLDSHFIGDILYFDYRYTLDDQRESWYWESNRGGGCWLNVGWHLVFLLEWFFGSPQKAIVNKIKSCKRAWAYDTDDTVFATFNYPNFIGTAYLSVLDSFSEDSFKIVGSNGTIYISKYFASIVDNFGEISFKEKAENAASYFNLVTNIFQKENHRQLLQLNINTMKFIDKYL